MGEIIDFFSVKSVTIYPDAGRIIRSKNVSFGSGINTLIVTGLPQDITVSTLRVSIENNEIRINDVFVEDRYLNVFDENKYSALKKELDTVLMKRKVLEKDIAVYNDEFGLFENRQSISNNVDESSLTVINLKNWEEYLDFAGDRMKNNRNDFRNAMFEWIGLDTKIKAMQAELQKYSSYDVRKEHVARIIVDAGSETETEVDLMYMQNGINWYPAYNLRVNSLEKNISVTMFALVSQQTGEDWNAVEVMLSTSRPMSNCDIPELMSKRIREADAEIEVGMMNEVPAPKMQKSRLRKESMKKAAFEASMNAEDEIADYDDECCKEEPSIESPLVESPAVSASSGMSTGMPKTEFGKSITNFLPDEYRQLEYYMNNKYVPDFKTESQATINNYFLSNVYDPGNSLGGYDYRYKVAKVKNDIPSSSVPIQLSVETRELPLTMNYICIPLDKEDVFLKGKFRNNDNPLPYGPAQVFIDNDFLGNIILPSLGNKQSTEISLGIERDIKVVRRENSKRRTKGIMIGKDIVTDFEIEIELASYKDEQVEISIYDRIPIWDKKKDAEIIDIEYDPGPDKISERNVLLWKKKPVKNEKFKLKVSYSVKQPENSILRMMISDSVNYEI